MGSMSWLRRVPGNQSRAVYLVVWTAMALPLLIDLCLGYIWPGRESGRQWMNVDLGKWAIRLFLLTLAITPAARLLRRPAIARYRRMVALFAFTYAMIHSVDYILYAHAWRFPLRIWERRLYLAVGIAAMLWMIPLAVTSFDGLRRRMGPKSWRALHAGVYAITMLVIVHTLWEYLTDWIELEVYCAVMVGLLALRLPPVFATIKAIGRPAGVTANPGPLES